MISQLLAILLKKSEGLSLRQLVSTKTWKHEEVTWPSKVKSFSFLNRQKSYWKIIQIIGDFHNHFRENEFLPSVGLSSVNNWLLVNRHCWQRISDFWQKKLSGKLIYPEIFLKGKTSVRHYLNFNCFFVSNWKKNCLGALMPLLRCEEAKSGLDRKFLYLERSRKKKSNSNSSVIGLLGKGKNCL